MSTYNTAVGRKRGPKFKLSPQQAEDVRTAHEAGETPVDEIARQFGVTKQTIYNVLRRLREASAS
jgi:DNA invertase Pin-like site-specific DNA recombinase